MFNLVKFHVTIAPSTGAFEIVEGGSLAASGKITRVDEDRAWVYENYNPDDNDDIELDADDLYKELGLRGYDYGTYSRVTLKLSSISGVNFRGMESMNNSGTIGQLKWTGNWVTFMDTLLQTSIGSTKAFTLVLVTYF